MSPRCGRHNLRQSAQSRRDKRVRGLFHGTTYGSFVDPNPSAKNRIYGDGAGTTLFTGVGDGYGYLRDRSGSGNNVQQAFGANQPPAGIQEGHYYWTNTGSNEHFQITLVSNIATAQMFCMMAIRAPSSTTAWERIVTLYNSGGNDYNNTNSIVILERNSNSSTFDAFRNSSQLGNSSLSNSTLNVVMSGIDNSNNHNWAVNRGTVQKNSTSATALNANILEFNRIGSTYSNARNFGTIVMNRFPNETEISLLWRFFGQRIGKAFK